MKVHEEESTPIINMGDYVLNYDLAEGKDLLEFLKYWLNVSFKDKPVLGFTISDMYKTFLDFRNEGVDYSPYLEIVVQQFGELHDAYISAVEP